MRWLAASLVGIASAPAVFGQVPLTPIQGKYCAALAPGRNYAFVGENPAGAAFGADLIRDDRAIAASYFVAGVDPGMRTGHYGRFYSSPQQAALSFLSSFGQVAVQCAAPQPVGQNLFLMQCRTAQYVGVALYQVFPWPNNGYALVMRTAGTGPALWAREGESAAALARSIRCNVPLRPTAVDWTSGPKPSGGRSRRGERDSEYSRWLGREHYHDPSTGENFWVSPSADWRENGPRGPGYYVNRGGETRKLEPGRSD